MGKKFENGNTKFSRGEHAVLMVDILKMGGKKYTDYSESVLYPALKTIVRVLDHLGVNEYRVEIEMGVTRRVRGCDMEPLSILDQIFGKGYCYENGIM